MHRRYQSSPTVERLQWECVGCGLICDRPLQPLPEFSLELAPRLAHGETITAKLRFDNRASEGYYAVVGCLLLDRRGHGVARPPPFAFELPPDSEHELEVALTSVEPPAPPHRHYVRLLLLINGAWVLANRTLIVTH